ncbi:MAG: cell wall-binding repeat-containing protein [Actinomycetales bacterium]
MSKATKRLRRAGTGGLTAAVALGTLIASTGVANATSNYDLTRVFGQDRYETSVAAVKLAFSSSDNVILASGDDAHTVDALGANYLAGVLGAPVLLTDIDSTPDEVVNEITALGAKNVWIVGGKAAVSEAQQAALDAKFDTVKRVAGFNRYETDKAVIDAGDDVKVGTVDGKKVAFVASGTSFADALSAAAISWKANLPVAITGRGSLDANAKAALAEAGIQKVYVLGGQAVISDDVVNELTALGYAPERVYGQNRSDTSVALAKWAMDKGIISKTVLHVASGQQSLNGADALSAGAVAGKFGQGLVVTNSRLDVGAVDDFVKAHANELTGGVVFGGPTAIADSVVAQIEAAGKQTSSNQAFSVAPSTSATLAASSAYQDDSSTSANEASGARSFTVSGLDDTKSYTVALFPASYVSVDAGGLVTFRDTEGTTTTSDDNGVADYAAPTSARITSVNNQTVATPNVKGIETATPVGGKLLFTINAIAADDVVPVVFTNVRGGTSTNAATGEPGLDLNADNSPSEPFALGGETSWTAAAASDSDTTSAAAITAVDKGANTFTTTTVAGPAKTFTYDDNDTLSVNGKRVLLSDFEKALTRGDAVTVSTYYTTPGLPSEIKLTDDAPDAPAVTTDLGTGTHTNRVTVHVNPATPTGVSESDYTYVIQRAPYSAGNAVDSDYSTIATITAAQDADTSTSDVIDYVDDNLKAGTYTYRAAVVLDGEQSDFSTGAVTSQETAVAPNTDTVAPTSVDARVTSAILPGDAAASGNVWKVVFSEDIQAPADGSKIRVKDADGTIVDVVCGTGTATCTVNAAPETVGSTEYAANRVLTVTLAATPAVAGGNDGTVTGAQYPLTVIGQLGVTDTAGNPWNVTSSVDNVIDAE